MDHQNRRIKTTIEEKIKKIIAELAGVDPSDMTTMELAIRDIVEEKRAIPAEKIAARKNTERII